MRALKIGLIQLLNRCVLHVFTTRKNTENEGETLSRVTDTKSTL